MLKVSTSTNLQICFLFLHHSRPIAFLTPEIQVKLLKLFICVAFSYLIEKLCFKFKSRQSEERPLWKVQEM